MAVEPRHDVQQSPADLLDDFFIGKSSAIKNVRAVARQVADEDSTVLITGGTGTGKNLLASLIHKASQRRKYPFCEILLPGINLGTFESELMGSTKGAFTGSVKNKLGRIRGADGGTVLLDEIGELPMNMQTKLHHFLESKMVHAVGAAQPVRVNVRVIASTNTDLHGAMKRHEFRSDLYYRISRFSIELPSLADRKEDIPLLIEHKLNLLHHARGVPFKIPDSVVRWLAAQTFMGNVRQLFDAIEGAVIRATPRLKLRTGDFVIR